MIKTHPKLRFKDEMPESLLPDDWESALMLAIGVISVPHPLAFPDPQDWYERHVTIRALTELGYPDHRAEGLAADYSGSPRQRIEAIYLMTDGEIPTPERKLTDDEVRNIRVMISRKWTTRTIAEKANVTPSTVCEIKKGRSYRGVGLLND